MEKNKEYIKNYDTISQEVKYMTNSLVRLKILASLHEKSMAMKVLCDEAGLSYSSVSSNMHELELNGAVYRQSNKYHLTSSAKLQIEHILELGKMITLLQEFFNILDKHLVHMIPNDSVAELYMLGKANLVESSSIDIYRMYNYIESVISRANRVKCVLPFYYENFNDQLNRLVQNNKKVEAIVPEPIFEVFESKSKIKKFFSFKGEYNFLLIITNEMMILGFFKDDGYFDRNRLLTSKDRKSIKWANNLFKNFKKENKEYYNYL